MNSKFREYSLIFSMLLILILSVGVVSAGGTNVSDVQLDNEDSVAEIIVEDISDDSYFNNEFLDSDDITSNGNVNDYSIDNANFDNTNYLENSDDVNFEFNNDSLIFILNDNSQEIPRVNIDLTDMDLPDKYDLRAVELEDGSVVSWVTPVKNQYYSGCCWSFATMAMLESYLLKNWGITYDFSENNLKNIMCNYTPGGSGYDPNNGGNFYLSLAYLLRWSGAVNESDDPYDWESTVSPSFNPLIHVQGVAYIPTRTSFTDNDQIKAAILNYGAIQTSIYWNDSYLNGSPYKDGVAYYYYGPSSIGTNHAVAIVGWDDNYDASNFKITPPGNGAFIIKNSWGSSFGDGGYCYVSYYDNSFAGLSEGSSVSAIAITSVENITNYDSIYYYDDFGNNGFSALGYSSNTGCFANQFISKSFETLSAFGIYTFGPSTYLANVSVNDKIVYSQNGSVDYGGYHTIKLNKFIDLKEGDLFKISIKLTTPGCLYPIAIESNFYNFPAYAEPNQSFISANGRIWTDLTTTSGNTFSNVCLKAYTFIKSTTFIKMDDVSVDLFENGSYVIKVFDNKNNLVNCGNITLYCDDIKVGDFGLCDGIFIWNFTNLSYGVHDIKVFYNFNYRYSESFMVKTITVNKLSVDLSVDSIECDALSSIILVANVNSKRSVKGVVVFFVDGVKVGSSNVTDGVAKLNYACGSAGNFVISAILNENDLFKSSENSSSLTVYKLVSNISIDNSVTNVNTKTKLVANVNAKYVVNECIVIFFVDGVEVGSSNVVNGIATFDYIPTKVGDFSISVNYIGSDIYNSSSASSHIFVDYLNTTLNFNNIDSPVGYDTIIDIQILDINGNIVDVDNVKVIYENNNSEMINIINGKIIIPTSTLAIGNYNICLVFLGDEIYRGSNKTISINVSKISTNLSMFNYLSSLGKTIELKADLISDYEINEGYVTFYINGVKIATVDVEDNQAIYPYLCNAPGVFTVKAIYNGSNVYESSSKDVSLTVKDFIKMTIKQNNTYYNSSFITITLNKSINAQKITLKFSNGKTANVTTNSKGIATYYIPFAVGSYTVNASASNNLYNFESNPLSFKITKANYIITPSKLSTTYNSGKYFQVKVTNSKNDKIVSRVKLKLKVYTGSSYKTVYITTGTNGIAKYSGSTLSIATHKIIVSIVDSKNISATSKTNSIIVNKGITTVSAPIVKNKYNTNKYFSVLIKNKASGKVINGLYLKIKVCTGKKYKTYTVKTNSKGIAKINTKALKKGKHKVVISTTNKYYTVSKSGYLINIVK